MSRNVAKIGLRPIQHLSRPAIPSTQRFLSSAILISPASLSLRTLATARTSARPLLGGRHAANQNTQALLARSPAPAIAHLRWKSAFHTHARQPILLENLHSRDLRQWSQQCRGFSDKKVQKELGATQRAQKETPTTPESARATPTHAVEDAGHKTIMERLPHPRLPHLHRPTKEELLAAATGFWQRLGIRFKWFSIRSFRPYTFDEIGAFVSWIFLGHVLWIVIGTTTFVSLGIWALNTVFTQETIAGWVGNYLTKSSGTKVVFESAVVPTWKSGVITFNNVFVSRRPGQQAKRERSVSKGSSTTAAAAAEAAMAEHQRNNATSDDPDAADGNYSQFDVTIQSVNVTLSFSKWFNGKGLLHEVEVQGVRGVIDRTSVRPTQGYVDPKSYRHEHSTGDFEIDDFKMSDVLLTVYQPGGFRPFTVSVFNCALPRLRKQWLFYDFLSANHMSGSFDDSLFTVHPRQVHSRTGVILARDGHPDDDADGDQWKKHSRLRIDGLNIDHLNRGVSGPFSWIQEGNVDVVADVMIPNDEDGVWKQSWRKSTEAVSELYDRIEHTVTNANAQVLGSEPAPQSHKSSSTFSEPPAGGDEDRDARFVVLDISIHLNDVVARVPLFTRDLSYVNNALVRPIVAYINKSRSFIPVQCRVVKPQAEFDGSWTVFDSGLLDDLSKEVYTAFVRGLEDGRARGRRMRKVGWWGLQLVGQALFVGLTGQLA